MTQPSTSNPFSAENLGIQNPAELNKYIPIDAKYIETAGNCHFEVFIFNKDRQRFVLFKNEEAYLDSEKMLMLTKNGTQPVFIPSEYSYQLNEFLSENLAQVVNDPNLPLAEKTEKFHTMANTVMKNLFDSPPDMKTFVSTAKNVSDSISDLLVNGPESIAQLTALRSYDYYTYSHSMNVTVLSIGLFQEIVSKATEDKIKDLTRGVLLHDVGKCDVPTELTNKKGKLTDDEWMVMKAHTTKGYERLKEDHELSEDSRYVSLYHHEGYDGSGYPMGISGLSIPFTSRVCKVCDVYDALTSKRSYKSGMQAFEALQLMTGEMKNKFDPEILKVFILFLQKMGKLSVGR